MNSIEMDQGILSSVRLN